MNIVPSLLAIALSAIVLVPASAVAEPMKHAPGGMTKDEAPMGAMAEGMVKKVDKSRGRLTIKHGPLASLNMPPMTMVFRVSDAAMLDAVKPGDKIKFVAEDLNGALTVTQLEAAE